MDRTVCVSCAVVVAIVFVGGCGAGIDGARPAPVPLEPNTQCASNSEDLGKWFIAGLTPRKYTLRLDASVSCNAMPSVSLRSTLPASTADFGTMMTQHVPSSLLGKRVRMSGYVRSDRVTGWAGLWMRVDDANKGVLAFDNMQTRAIVGTADWVRYEVVLDVPDDASNVLYGILLSGEGAVWLSGVVVEVVDDSVQVTGGG